MIIGLFIYCALKVLSHFALPQITEQKLTESLQLLHESTLIRVFNMSYNFNGALLIPLSFNFNV